MDRPNTRLTNSDKPQRGGLRAIVDALVAISQVAVRIHFDAPWAEPEVKQPAKGAHNPNVHALVSSQPCTAANDARTPKRVVNIG